MDEILLNREGPFHNTIHPPHPDDDWEVVWWSSVIEPGEVR